MLRSSWWTSLLNLVTSLPTSAPPSISTSSSSSSKSSSIGLEAILVGFLAFAGAGAAFLAVEDTSAAGFFAVVVLLVEA